MGHDVKTWSGATVAILGATVILGCTRGATPSPLAGDAKEEFVGQDAQVTAAQLVFTDPAEGERLARVRSCFEGRAAAGQDWRHDPLRKIGCFVQEDWCRGKHSSNCAGYMFRSDRGDEWYRVHTLHHDSSWPEVFGIGVSAGRQATSGDWGVSFSYTANGARIVGEGLSVAFHHFTGDEIDLAVELGSSYARDAVEAHAAAFHQMLSDLMQFEQCW